MGDEPVVLYRSSEGGHLIGASADAEFIERMQEKLDAAGMSSVQHSAITDKGQIEAKINFEIARRKFWRSCDEEVESRRETDDKWAAENGWERRWSGNPSKVDDHWLCHNRWCRTTRIDSGDVSLDIKMVSCKPHYSDAGPDGPFLISYWWAVNRMYAADNPVMESSAGTIQDAAKQVLDAMETVADTSEE